MLMIVIPILLIPSQKSKVGMLTVMNVMGEKKIYFCNFKVKYS